MNKTWPILIALTSACGTSKQSGTSPLFKADDVLTISGRFLTSTGAPLANRSMALRNLQRTAYYDPTATYFSEFERELINTAFPMFPSYEGSYESKKVVPNYFIKQAKTANDGSFQFQIRADQLLRDAKDAIHITLINDGNGVSDSYAKYNLIIKDKTTALDAIPQCKLDEVRTESNDRVEFNWALPGYTVDHYEFRFGDARDNSLLWVTQVDAAVTTLSLPKTIFMESSLRYAVEIFYRFEDDLQMSCLTPSQTFTLQNPKANSAAGRTASAENISFKVTSLTNGRFKDTSYFEAFDTRWVIIDLGVNTLIRSISLHNLQFAGKDENKISVEGATADDPDNFQALGLDSLSALRFATYDLAAPGSWAKIKVSSPAVFANLQELTIQ